MSGTDNSTPVEPDDAVIGEPTVLSSHDAFETMLGLVTLWAPTLAAGLEDAHQLRGYRLLKLGEFVVVLPGLDELLRALFELEPTLRGIDGLRSAAQLVTRVRGDFETAIEALLGGRHGVISDAMRDCMEIEMLLRDFARDPDQLERWLAADDRTLRREFSPDAVRKRLAGPGLELPDTLEYKHHSEALHPVPNPPDLDTYSRVLTTDGSVDTLARHALELLEHGRRVLDAIDDLLDTRDVAREDRPPRRHDRVRMRDAYEFLFEPIAPAMKALVSEGHLPTRSPQARGTARDWRSKLERPR